MRASAVRLIELPEWQPVQVPSFEVGAEALCALQRHHQTQVHVAEGSTLGSVRLTNWGFAGMIVLPGGLHLRLLPKVPHRNLLRMLTETYGLQHVGFASKPGSGDTPEGLLSHMADQLAEQAITRVRRGVHRSYAPRQGLLPYVRGSVDITRSMRRPLDERVCCSYDEHTADIEDNRLLHWALFVLSRSSAALPDAALQLRKAYNAFAAICTLRSYRPLDYADRHYTRLNGDYSSMHLLSRLLLEALAPDCLQGYSQSVAFTVAMDKLFERYVWRWLSSNLPEGYSAESQLCVRLREEPPTWAFIDVAIRDTKTNHVVCILDTKYKLHARPSKPDLYQATAYAASQLCTDAFLVYPHALEQAAAARFGKISVGAISFDLAADLDESGDRLLSVIKAWGAVCLGGETS